MAHQVASHVFGFAFLWIITFPAAAQTQDPYPSRPIRLIVAFPAGASTNDILGRAIAQRLSTELGRSVIVDNRPGAGGVLGTGIVAKAAPDGYTLLLATNAPIAVSPHVLKTMPYDPLKDLAAVAMFAVVPYVLVVHPSVPATNVKELIAYAQAHPGRLRFASAGIATTPQLCGELFKMMAGVDIVHVPYKGGAPANTATVSGETAIYCAGLGTQLPQIRAGRLRAIALTTLQRSAIMPELPTAHEQGLTGFDVVNWNGIMGPAELPRSVIQRLHAAMSRIAESQEWKSYLHNQGIEPVLMGSAEFSEHIRNESAKWGRVVKAAGITGE